MVSRPHAVSIAKRRAQKRDDLGEYLRPFGLLELLEEGAAEGLEPSSDADIELRRPRYEHDGLDRKAALLEQPAIFGDRGKEPRRALSGSPPCRAPTARMAVAMAATLP
jgi:hypothetical protein